MSGSEKRLLTILAHVHFWALALIALVHAEARCLFVDNALQLFHLLRTEDFFYSGQRFGTIIPQIAPLLAIKAEATIEQVVQIYSLSFTLFHYVIFLIIRYGLKDIYSALAVALIYCIAGFHVFYIPASQLPLALSLIILVFAIANNKDLRNYAVIISILILSAIAIYLHPLAFLPFAFLLGLKIFRDGFDVPREYWVICGLILALFIFRTFITPSGYESGKMPESGSLFNRMINVNHLASTKLFGKWLLGPHLPLLLIFLHTGFVLIRRRQWVSFTWVIGFSLGLFVLVSASFPNTLYPHYIQTLYLPVSFVLMVAWVFVVWRPMQLKNAANLLVIFLLFYGAFMTARTAGFYEERLDILSSWMEETQDFPENKIILCRNNAIPDRMIMTWAVPFESMLYSGIHEDELRTINVLGNINEFDDLDDRDDVMLDFEWRYFTSDFSGRLLYIPSGPYRKINSKGDEEWNTLVNDASYQSGLKVVTPGDFLRSFEKSSDLWLPVRIENINAALIPSMTNIPNPVYVSASWSDDFRILEHLSTQTPLLMDVIDSLNQDAYIRMPDNPGEYQLKVGLKCNGLELGEAQTLLVEVY